MAKEKLEIIVDAKGVAQTKQEFKSLSRAEQQVVLQSKRANRQFNRMRVSTAGLRRTLGVVRNNLLLVTFAFGGAVIALKKFITVSGDAAEIMSKFQAVFKEHSIETELWAGTFGEAVGRAKIDVVAWASTLQDTFVPLGFARDKASELSKSLVELAVDVASFNNQADADVIRDFQSALVGNHETVRKYGIVITEAALKQQFMKSTLTDQEKVQGRLNLLLAGTADAQGDAVRTADSYNNRVKAATAATKAMSIALGEWFIPAAETSVMLWEKMAKAVTGLVGPPKIDIQSQIDQQWELLNIYEKQLLYFRNADPIYKKYQESQIERYKGLAEQTENLLGILLQIRDAPEKQKEQTAAVETNTEAMKRLVGEYARWINSLGVAGYLLPDISDKMAETEKKMKALNASLAERRGMIAGLQTAGSLAGNLSSALLTAGDSGMSAAAAFHDAWHRALRSIIAQITANAAILALANIFMPGAGITAKSGGLMGALLGGVKFAQHGMDQTISKPTIIVAGERGPERVKISPQAGPSPSGNVYHIHLHAPIPEDYMRNDFLPLFRRVQAID